MIVKVGGLLYIVSASLSLLSMFKTAGYLGTGSVISGLTLAAFNGAIGVGLLQYANWARWLALGVSLLTWTLGSVAVFFMLVYGLKFMFAGAGAVSGFLAIAVIIAGGVLAAIIVINYKLFHYLRTEEAQVEFDTPEFESWPVLKSTGLYLVMVIALGSFESMGRRSAFDRAMMRSAMNESATDVARDRELAAQRREAEILASSLERERQVAREREESNRRKLEELSRIASAAEADLERERREAAMNEFRSEQRRLNEQRRADLESRARNPGRASQSNRDYDAESRRLAERLDQRMRGSTSASGSETSGSTASATNGKILKCRDASGSLQFTQGYCPAGTTLVAPPPGE